MRYWADVNPHWMVETHARQVETLKAWAGILVNYVVGPIFIDGDLNGKKYLDMLQHEIVPAINEVAQGSYDPVFQQNGAPPHRSVHVLTFLNQHFPKIRSTWFY